MNPVPNSIQWAHVVSRLKATFGLSDNLGEIAQSYLSNTCAETEIHDADAMPLNIYISANRIQIHVSAIHGC